MDEDTLFDLCVRLGEAIYLKVSPEITFKRINMARNEGLINNNENLSDFYSDVSQMLLEWFEAQDKADEI